MLTEGIPFALFAIIIIGFFLFQVMLHHNDYVVNTCKLDKLRCTMQGGFHLIVLGTSLLSNAMYISTLNQTPTN